jgi:uncharacterized membrane protein YeaQ/YmgE (transglycosylase-associated protein family)
MPILIFVVVGVAAGFIATSVMGVKANPLTTIILGIVGALVGGLALRFLFMMGGLVIGFIAAILGAMLLIWLWQKYGRNG